MKPLFKNKNLLFFFFLNLYVSKSFGQNPVLYGMSGTNLFKINGDGSSYSILHSFTAKTGYIVTSTLLKFSNDEFLGFTGYGGDTINHFFSSNFLGYGTIFLFNHTNNTYRIIYKFNGVDGCVPSGNPLISSNGKVYGTTTYGGSNNLGTIFSFRVSDSTYTNLFNFSNNTSRKPNGSLLEASNGILYGLSFNGPMNGTLFSYDTLNNTYTNLFNFNSSVGSYPTGKLIQRSNGKLYGLTSSGGSSVTTPGDGVIFSYDFLNSFYNKEHVCSLDSNGINGYGLQEGLVEANNGKLYGTTDYGGAYHKGVIFCFDPSINSYQKLFDFNGINGATPLGTLIQASDGNLYGMTFRGGNFDWGVIFKFNLSNSQYTKLLDFDIQNGASPRGSLIELIPTNNGLIQHKLTEVHIFPNPIFSELTINTNNYFTKKIILKDYIGNNLIEKSFDKSITLNISNFTKGIYFLEIKSIDEHIYKKILKL